MDFISNTLDLNQGGTIIAGLVAISFLAGILQYCRKIVFLAALVISPGWLSTQAQLLTPGFPMPIDSDSQKLFLLLAFVSGMIMGFVVPLLLQAKFSFKSRVMFYCLIAISSATLLIVLSQMVTDNSELVATHYYTMSSISGLFSGFCLISILKMLFMLIPIATWGSAAIAILLLMFPEGSSDYSVENLTGFVEKNVLEVSNNWDFNYSDLSQNDLLSLNFLHLDSVE